MLGIRTLSKLVCCIAVVSGPTTCMAQQEQTAPPRQRGDLDAIRKVSTLIGTEVMNSSKAKIATVRDLAFAPDGGVCFVILGYGGVAGVGETYTAAPLDATFIHQDNGKWAVDLDMTAEDLKKAPAMRSENCRELTDTNWVARVDQFFRPAQGRRMTLWKNERSFERERQAVRPLLLATKLRSANFKNNRNEELGKLEDLLLDGRYHAAFAIMGQGGVLGIGGNYIPIPWSKLGFKVNPEANAVAVTIDVAKEQLEKAPLVKGNNYATLLAPGFADGVRRYFGVKKEGAANGDDGKAG